MSLISCGEAVLHRGAGSRPRSTGVEPTAPLSTLRGGLRPAGDRPPLSFSTTSAELGELVQVLAREEPVGERARHACPARARRPSSRRDRCSWNGVIGRPSGANAFSTVSERGALVDRVRRLAHDLGEQPVHDEAGGVGGEHRVLAAGSCATTNAVESAASVVCGVFTISMSGMTATGLKKWKPTSRSGCVELRADLLDRQRRGVGREDRVVGDDLLDLGEHLLLDAELLEDGLDDAVAVRELGSCRSCRDERAQPVRLVARRGGPWPRASSISSWM